MNHSGDAAEQIVRMSLEGVEVVARLTGTAAKEMSLLLLAALKNNSQDSLKLKGRARLTSMLKSGKPLEIFSVKESDLKQFMEGAKQYGIVYCVLRSTKNRPDELCDIMVKADDAPKISRMIERFKFATVDRAQIESEIVADRDTRTENPAAREGLEANERPDAPPPTDVDALVDELLAPSTDASAPEAPIPKETATNPSPAKTNPPPPSAPTSGSKPKSERGAFSRPSVREELRGIAAGMKNKDTKEADTAARADSVVAEKPKPTTPPPPHKQPRRRGNSKSKRKGAR